MDLPKIRSVDVDPSNPDGDRLVLLRVSKEGTEVLGPVAPLYMDSRGASQVS